MTLALTRSVSVVESHDSATLMSLSGAFEVPRKSDSETTVHIRGGPLPKEG